MAWAEAGAAPYLNTIGQDPGLRDPQHGDFRADLAPAHGCRVFPPEPRRRGVTAGPANKPLPAAIPVRRERLDVGGTIDQDTVWDATEVRVISDVQIIGGATLGIAAGASVVFTDYHGLTVHDGSLQAVGTADSPIHFISEQPDLWRPDEGTAGAWAGLAFVNVPARRDSSRLRWCVIECAKALPGRTERPGARGDWPGDGTGGERGGQPGGQLDAGLGGAVRVIGGSPVLISHSILRHNLAERGGAVGVHYGAAPLLVNNLIHDNHALLRGAGLYASHSYPVLVHNTFSANTTAAPSPWVNTGCLDHMHARALQLGGIIWGNPTTNFEGLQIRGAKAFYTRYCSIEGWLGGEGCQTDDPLLDALSEPPFAPGAGSPVIDAGDVGSVGPWLPALDLAGRARVIGQTVDLGAQERPAATSAPSAAGPASLLLAAAPNPFNPQTIIAWWQPQAGTAYLAIHDARGRRVRVLHDGWLAAGPAQAVWDGGDDHGRRLAGGVYLARLKTATGRASLKLVSAP
jgi:hypothetical protein